MRSSPSSPCRRLLPAAPAAFLSLSDGSLPSPLGALDSAFFRRITTLALSVSLWTWMPAFFQLRKKSQRGLGTEGLFVFCFFFFFGGVGGGGGVTALL